MANGNMGYGSIDRRKVLKGLAVGVGTTAGSVSVVSAQSASDITGISYDTLTNTRGKEVTGNINVVDDELRGTLNIAGFAIPLERLEKKETKSSKKRKFSESLTDGEFSNGDAPLKVTVNEHYGNFSGVLGRPSGEFGHLGFFAGDDVDIDSEQTSNQDVTRQRWAQNSNSFSVPDEGLPTDSGPRRLKKILRANENSSINGGDD